MAEKPKCQLTAFAGFVLGIGANGPLAIGIIGTALIGGKVQALLGFASALLWMGIFGVTGALASAIAAGCYKYFKGTESVVLRMVAFLSFIPAVVGAFVSVVAVPSPTDNIPLTLALLSELMQIVPILYLLRRRIEER